LARLERKARSQERGSDANQSTKKSATFYRLKACGEGSSQKQEKKHTRKIRNGNQRGGEAESLIIRFLKGKKEFVISQKWEGECKKKSEKKSQKFLLGDRSDFNWICVPAPLVNCPRKDDRPNHRKKPLGKTTRLRRKGETLMGAN